MSVGERALAGGLDDVGVRAFQQLIAGTYGERDAERGLLACFAWFVEEVGELSRALRADDRDNLEAEFADVLAWLVTLAEQADVDLAVVAGRYLDGCPKCSATPCTCPGSRTSSAVR